MFVVRCLLRVVVRVECVLFVDCLLFVDCWLSVVCCMSLIDVFGWLLLVFGVRCYSSLWLLRVDRCLLFACLSLLDVRWCVSGAAGVYCSLLAVVVCWLLVVACCCVLLCVV